MANLAAQARMGESRRCRSPVHPSASRSRTTRLDGPAGHTACQPAGPRRPLSRRLGLAVLGVTALLLTGGVTISSPWTVPPPSGR
ncbi:hypothetical protein ACFQU7_07905 [Pseudoroseomonas wenyumeiae]